MLDSLPRTAVGDRKWCALFGGIGDGDGNGDGNEASSAECCSVCCDAFVGGDVATVLLCAHAFHEHCVGPWLSIRSTCPVCRARVRRVTVVQTAALWRTKRKAHDAKAAKGTTATTAAHRRMDSSDDARRTPRLVEVVVERAAAAEEEEEEENETETDTDTDTESQGVVRARAASGSVRGIRPARG